MSNPEDKSSQASPPIDLRHLADVFDPSPTLTVMLRGPEHHVDYANPAFLRTVGVDVATGLRLVDIMAPSVYPAFESALEAARSSGRLARVDGVYFAHDGAADSQVDFVCHAVSGNDGMAGILVQGTDVTDRIRMLEGLGSAFQRGPTQTEGDDLGEDDNEVYAGSIARDLPPILLAEDYEPNILVATTLLSRLGYKVEVVTDGQAAVTKALNGKYALVLMDVQMPKLNGVEATRAIRAAEAESGAQRLPVIGVTAHALSINRDQCLAAGMDDFLTKPYTPAELAETLNSVLAEYSPGAIGG